jgi:hypothetical protein
MLLNLSFIFLVMLSMNVLICRRWTGPNIPCKQMNLYQQCDSYGVPGNGPIRTTESERGEWYWIEWLIEKRQEMRALMGVEIPMSLQYNEDPLMLQIRDAWLQQTYLGQTYFSVISCMQVDVTLHAACCDNSADPFGLTSEKHKNKVSTVTNCRICQECPARDSTV